jgi:ribosomal protein S13
MAREQNPLPCEQNEYMAEILSQREITPEQRAELRAQMQEDARRAAAAGVYKRLREAHEQAVRERLNPSMLRDGEPRSMRTAEEEDAYYRSIQLTPEQKAELRAELKKNMERAAAAGVYKRLREAHEQAVRERAMEATLRDGKVRRKK